MNNADFNITMLNVLTRFNILQFHLCHAYLSKVHKKTGADLISKGIVGWHLGIKQKVTSQIRPHNTIADEFGTSLALNFGKAIEF